MEEELKRLARVLRETTEALRETTEALEQYDAVADRLEELCGTEETEMILWSQRDPRWRNQVYAGNTTFGTAGCYVVCVAMMISLAGYTDDPPTVAQKLRDANCFSGNLLTRPDRIPDAYPRMRYDGPVDVSKDGELRWHNRRLTDDDWTRFCQELEQGALIMEVDFNPASTEFNQHFVIAETLTPDKNDIIIADPWDGAATRLLERYAQDHWDLRRAIYGVRLLRPR